MKYPKTLYVRMEVPEDSNDGDAEYAAGVAPEVARDYDGPSEQALGVYQFVGTVQTRTVLETSPLNQAVVRDEKTGAALSKPKRR